MGPPRPGGPAARGPPRAPAILGLGIWNFAHLALLSHIGICKLAHTERYARETTLHLYYTFLVTFCTFLHAVVNSPLYYPPYSPGTAHGAKV